MTVILVATVAVTLGGLLAIALTHTPQLERCRIPTSAERRYNDCALHKSHDGVHIAADGHRY
jgi:hypothetical protein